MNSLDNLDKRTLYNFIAIFPKNHIKVTWLLEGTLFTRF